MTNRQNRLASHKRKAKRIPWNKGQAQLKYGAGPYGLFLSVVNIKPK